MRRLYHIATLLTVLLAVIVVAGCSDRGNNMPTQPITYGNTWAALENYAFYPYLAFQRENPDGQLQLATWMPRGLPDSLMPASLLILLAPEDADQWFYFERGLHKVCNELYNTGQIPPMVVVCVSNSKLFGGYFYAQSIPGGLYDDVLGDLLIDRLQFKYPSLINSADHRGIGGLGQGAYGAFRAAIKNPGTFSSISVMDGPLDFDGADGQSGFIKWFGRAITENGGPAHYRQIDTSQAKPASRMFVGGSIAFSPHDTSIVVDGTRNDEDFPLYIQARYSINDPQSQITHLLTGATGSASAEIKKAEAIRFDFHLPFDSTGHRRGYVWNFWMQNNLEDMYESGGSNAFDDAKIWIATSPEARLGFHEQTVSWANYLRSEGVDVDTLTYTGYDGNPATGGQYVYNMLSKMIKFHGDHFRAVDNE